MAMWMAYLKLLQNLSLASAGDQDATRSNKAAVTTRMEPSLPPVCETNRGRSLSRQRNSRHVLSGGVRALPTVSERVGPRPLHPRIRLGGDSQHIPTESTTRVTRPG